VVLNRKVTGQLASVAYCSKRLGPAERRYSTYEECLAVYLVVSARSYLEHTEFKLDSENLILCLLFKNVQDVGRLGRWIIRLAPFKF
jgi:hypothetical protein